MDARIKTRSAISMPDVDVQPDLDETSGSTDRASLFDDLDADELRRRWEAVQASFVDAPRRAVEQADGLVKDVLGRLETRFSEERARLEREWSSDDQANTEELRVALQHYRSFFERLLAV